MTIFLAAIINDYHQKCLAGDNSPAFINKTLKNALNVANISPEDLAKVILLGF